MHAGGQKGSGRLRLEEGLSLRAIRERLGIRSNAQIREWVKRYQQGESFEDYRGVWNRRSFDSLEKENAYWKAQVEFRKKRYPNLLGKG
jgi:transposase